MTYTQRQLKQAWHEATFMQGAQTPCAKHLFDAIHEFLKANVK